MKIRTSTTIKASRERLWPLLTNSEMNAPGSFCLGVPRPVECRLPDGEGAVGASRQCVSDRGVVNQEITCWLPPDQLQFKMIDTDHDWSPCVESITEQFDLEDVNNGTRITRTTTLRAKGYFRLLKEFGFYFGLKRVHYFVFKSWRRSAET